jgi:hypothetical protein
MIAAISATAVPLSQSLEAGQRDTIANARDTRRDNRGTPHGIAKRGNGLLAHIAGHTEGHLRCMWCPKLCTSGSLLRDKEGC